MKNEHKSALWDVMWQNAIGGIAIVDKDGTFLRANPAFCRIVEWSEPELQQKQFREITAPGDVEADVDLFDEVASGKRPHYDMVKSYITKSGKVVWVHLRVNPFVIDGVYHYSISQVFEVPVSIIRQMGVDADGVSYQLERAKPGFKINWRIIRDWTPIVIMSLIGAGYIVQQLAQQFPAG